MSNFTTWHLHMKFLEFYPCFHNSCEIWHSFSRTPMRNFLWWYYRWQITSLALEKCKKKNAIFFKLFWYKGFVHWKLKKLLNFLVDSVLILTKGPRVGKEGSFLLSSFLKRPSRSFSAIALSHAFNAPSRSLPPLRPYIKPVFVLNIFIDFTRRCWKFYFALADWLRDVLTERIKL